MPAFSDHNPTQPHRISFFALLMVTKGKGYHEIDLKRYNLKKGVVLKIAKGQVHAFQKNAKYEGFLIVFTETFILNYLSKSSIKLISHFYNYHIISPLAVEQNLNEAFLSQLFEEVKCNKRYAHENIIAAILDLYLLRLERKAQGDKAPNTISKHYTIFVRFKNLVEANYITTRNVKDYAEMLLVSSKHLGQVVQEYTLDSAKNFIDNYVILEAKRAIVSTDKHLKEIAYDTGFDEITNFTKFFKKKTGKTPKVFRLNRQ